MNFGTKLYVLVAAMGLSALSTGCVAGEVDESADGRLAEARELGAEPEAQVWSDWIDIAPGVRQRSSDRGALEQETSGVTGHRWLSDRIADELRDLQARAAAADADQAAALDSQIRATEERLAGVEQTLERLRVEEAIADAWADVKMAGDGRGSRVETYYYAEAQVYYSGYGGAYAGAQQSYGSGPAASLSAYAFVCMNGVCQGNSTSLFGTGIYQHSGLVNCSNGGGEFWGVSSVTVNATTVSASWSQHCYY